MDFVRKFSFSVLSFVNDEGIYFIFKSPLLTIDSQEV